MAIFIYCCIPCLLRHSVWHECNSTSFLVSDRPSSDQYTLSQHSLFIVGKLVVLDSRYHVILFTSDLALRWILYKKPRSQVFLVGNCIFSYDSTWGTMEWLYTVHYFSEDMHEQIIFWLHMDELKTSADKQDAGHKIWCGSRFPIRSCQLCIEDIHTLIDHCICRWSSSEIYSWKYFHKKEKHLLFLTRSFLQIPVNY